MEKEAYAIFECIGEPAKDIIATAVVAAIKKAHPERQIAVVTLTPDIWLHNPDVFRVYKLGAMSYFYDDYIKGKDTLVFRHDPYVTTDYIYARKHVIDIWCDLCKVPRAGAMPSLHFTWREKEAVGKLTSSSPWERFYIQANGSMDPQLPYLWQKDIPAPIASRAAEAAAGKGYYIAGIRNATNPGAMADSGAGGFPFNYRQTLCSLLYSKRRLLIDADMIQAATALNLPSVALYVAGSPEVSGYAMHKNIRALAHLSEAQKKDHAPLIEFMDSYKDGYDIRGAKRICPFPLDDLFSADEIITALDL